MFNVPTSSLPVQQLWKEASDRSSRQKRKYCTSRRGERAGIIPNLSSSGNEKTNRGVFSRQAEPLEPRIPSSKRRTPLSPWRGEAAPVSPAERDHEYNIDFKLRR